MGEVMRKAVQVDEDQFFKVQEKLAQLEVRAHVIAKDRSSFWSSRLALECDCVCQVLNNNKKWGWWVRLGGKECFLFIFKFVVFLSL